MAYEKEHCEFIRDELLKDRNYDEVATAFRKKHKDFQEHTTRNSVSRLIRDGKIRAVSTSEQYARIEDYIARRSTNRTVKRSPERESFLALRKIGAGRSESS